MTIKELREAVGGARILAAKIDATERTIYRWESRGFVITSPGIHPVFQLQMAKLAKKLRQDNNKEG
jgi:hypothetical protein